MKSSWNHHHKNGSYTDKPTPTQLLQTAGELEKQPKVQCSTSAYANEFGHWPKEATELLVVNFGKLPFKFMFLTI